VAYLLLITGALLILIAALPAWRVLQAGAGAALTSRDISPAGGDGREAIAGREEAGRENELAGRLAALQAEVAVLRARIEDRDAMPATTPPEEADAGAAGRVFQAYLAAARAGDRAAPPPAAAEEPAPAEELLSFQEQIRRAHAAGEGIDSLARRFGRGKGEIALILNLQR